MLQSAIAVHLSGASCWKKKLGKIPNVHTVYHAKQNAFSLIVSNVVLVLVVADGLVVKYVKRLLTWWSVGDKMLHASTSFGSAKQMTHPSASDVPPGSAFCGS